MRKQGFTLVELVIAVAIIAILAVIIFVAINPSKLMAKSRDSQRFSDVTNLATAVNLYLADNKDFSKLAEKVYISNDSKLTNNETRKKNDGTGWIPLDFSSLSSGAPLSVLPLDPKNSGDFIYNFGISKQDKTYEINCVFEHSENIPKHGADGGNNTQKYEVGTDLTVLGN